MRYLSCLFQWAIILLLAIVEAQVTHGFVRGLRRTTPLAPEFRNLQQKGDMKLAKGCKAKKGETCAPTASPTSSPIPTHFPSDTPSAQPSISHEPTLSGVPSLEPTVSRPPSVVPSVLPTLTPTSPPSLIPSPQPSTVPSTRPSLEPSSFPTLSPSAIPSLRPSDSSIPSLAPSIAPSGPPSVEPTLFPTSIPSFVPSTSPTKVASGNPSTRPSTFPSPQPTTTTRPSKSPAPSFPPSTTVSPTTSPVPSFQPSPTPTDPPSQTVSESLSSGTPTFSHLAYDTLFTANGGATGLTSTCRADIPDTAVGAFDQLIAFAYMVNVEQGANISLVADMLALRIHQNLAMHFMTCSFQTGRSFFYVYTISSLPADKAAKCTGANVVNFTTAGNTECYLVDGAVTATIFNLPETNSSQRDLVQENITDYNINVAFATQLQYILESGLLMGPKVISTEFVRLTNNDSKQPQGPTTSDINTGQGNGSGKKKNSSKVLAISGYIFAGLVVAVLLAVGLVVRMRRQSSHGVLLEDDDQVKVDQESKGRLDIMSRSDDYNLFLKQDGYYIRDGTIFADSAFEFDDADDVKSSERSRSTKSSESRERSSTKEVPALRNLGVSSQDNSTDKPQVDFIAVNPADYSKYCIDQNAGYERTSNIQFIEVDHEQYKAKLSESRPPRASMFTALNPLRIVRSMSSRMGSASSQANSNFSVKKSENVEDYDKRNLDPPGTPDENADIEVPVVPQVESKLEEERRPVNEDPTSLMEVIAVSQDAEGGDIEVNLRTDDPLDDCPIEGDAGRLAEDGHTSGQIGAIQLDESQDQSSFLEPPIMNILGISMEDEPEKQIQFITVNPAEYQTPLKNLPRSTKETTEFAATAGEKMRSLEETPYGANGKPPKVPKNIPVNPLRLVRSMSARLRSATSFKSSSASSVRRSVKFEANAIQSKILEDEIKVAFGFDGEERIAGVSSSVTETPNTNKTASRTEWAGFHDFDDLRGSAVFDDDNAKTMEDVPISGPHPGLTTMMIDEEVQRSALESPVRGKTSSFDDKQDNHGGVLHVEMDGNEEPDHLNEYVDEVSQGYQVTALRNLAYRKEEWVNDMEAEPGSLRNVKDEDLAATNPESVHYVPTNNPESVFSGLDNQEMVFHDLTTPDAKFNDNEQQETIFNGLEEEATGPSDDDSSEILVLEGDTVFSGITEFVSVASEEPLLKPTTQDHKMSPVDTRSVNIDNALVEEHAMKPQPDMDPVTPSVSFMSPDAETAPSGHSYDQSTTEQLKSVKSEVVAGESVATSGKPPLVRKMSPANPLNYVRRVTSRIRSASSLKSASTVSIEKGAKSVKSDGRSTLLTEPLSQHKESQGMGSAVVRRDSWPTSASELGNSSAIVVEDDEDDIQHVYSDVVLSPTIGRAVSASSGPTFVRTGVVVSPAVSVSPVVSTPAAAAPSIELVVEKGHRRYETPDTVDL